MDQRAPPRNGRQPSRCKVTPGPFQRLRRHFQCEGIGFLAECSDTDSAECWILDKLTLWNHVLHYAGLELVEQEPHTVQVNSLKLNFKVRYPHSDFVKECGSLICWLLERHRCITSVFVRFEEGTFWGKKSVSTATDNLQRVLRFKLDHRDPAERRRGVKAPSGVNVLKVVQEAEFIERFVLKFVLVDKYEALKIGSTLARRASLKELVLEDAEGFLDSQFSIPRNCDYDGRVIRGEGYDVVLLHFLKNLTPASTIQKVELRRSILGGACVAALADALRWNTTITSLTLCNCSLKPAHIRLLSGILETNASITHLNLSYNYGIDAIGDDGIVAIADALRRNSTLTHLDLRKTRIGHAGLTRLCEVEKDRDKLLYLDLSSNKFGDKGCAALADLIRTTSSLNDLQTNKCDVGGLGVVSLATALKENKSGLKVVFGCCFAANWKASDALTILMEHGVLDRTDGVWSARLEGCFDVLPKVVHKIKEMDVSPCGDGLHLLYYSGDYIRQGDSLTKLGDIDLDFVCHCNPLLALIETTVMLKELGFSFSTLESCFMVNLCKAVAKNRSLHRLRFARNAFRRGSSDLSPLVAVAEVLKVNKTLHTLELPRAGVSRSIAQAFASSLETNYGLTHFRIDCEEDCPDVMMDIERMVRRNAALCTKALHFVSQETVQKRYAASFDLTAYTGSLMDRVAELTRKSQEDAQKVIQSKMRFLHRNFFRITGIVKSSIKCHGKDTKQAQIDCLDAPSLAHIASYLKVADVH